MKGTRLKDGTFIDGPDVICQSITVDGKVWRFDFDSRFGPLWLKADGWTPRKNQNVSQVVWNHFDAWHRKYNKSNTAVTQERPEGEN